MPGEVGQPLPCFLLPSLAHHLFIALCPLQWAGHLIPPGTARGGSCGGGWRGCPWGGSLQLPPKRLPRPPVGQKSQWQSAGHSATHPPRGRRRLLSETVCWLTAGASLSRSFPHQHGLVGLVLKEGKGRSCLRGSPKSDADIENIPPPISLLTERREDPSLSEASANWHG